MREYVWLECTSCGERNYRTPKETRGAERLELKTHKRMIDILDSRAQTVDALTKLDLPAGVDVEIKVE